MSLRSEVLEYIKSRQRMVPADRLYIELIEGNGAHVLRARSQRPQGIRIYRNNLLTYLVVELFGYSIGEVADFSRRSKATVWSRYHRGRRIMEVEFPWLGEQKPCQGGRKKRLFKKK